MAKFQVLFGDSARPADKSFYRQLSTLEVEENADLPGAIQLTLPIATTENQDLTVVGEDRFKPYGRIAVVISIDGKPDACIFDGYVLSHKIRVDRGVTAGTVEVWGQDVSCLMNLEEKARPWTTTDGNAANRIFQEHGFRTAPANTEDDSATHEENRHLLMQRGTDAQFLRDRARRAGKLFRVCCDRRAGDNVGYFIKPKLDGNASQTLTLHPARNANVEALEFSWDVARPSEVNAKLLFDSKDAESGDVQASDLKALDARSLAAFTGKKYVKKAMLTTVVDSASELQIRSRSLLREAGWFVRCEGDVDLGRLDSVMRVGTLVQVNGAGRMHSGKYFVWSVRHTITAESHRLKFVLVRNAVGNA